MAEVCLQGPRIVSLVRESIAAGVPEHVRVRLEGKLGLDPGSLDHAGKPGGAEGGAALRGEHEGRLRLPLALKPPQRPQFIPKDWVGTRCALLHPADVQRGGPEVHLLPPQVDQLRDPEAVAVGHEDHRGVPMAPTVLSGRVHQPLDFGLGQVLAGPQVAIGSPLRGNCSIYDGWRDQPKVPFGHALRAPAINDCSYNDPFSNSNLAAKVRRVDSQWVPPRCSISDEQVHPPFQKDR